jgi:hypothetical protein
MPKVGFEPTIPVFKRANAFHALARAQIHFLRRRVL